MQELIDEIKNLNKNKIELLKAVNKPKIGWLSIYTPEEIFYAAGIIPFRITGESGIISAEACAMMHRTICSYVLSCLSEGLSGLYDFMDGIVFVDACDARKRIHEVWRSYIQPKFSYFFELPKDKSHVSREYFRLQVRQLITAIENQYNCKITETALVNAIQLYNKSRSLLQQMYEFRKSDASPITAIDAINIVKSSMSGFKEEFNTKLTTLLSLLEKQEIKKSVKKPRVLICGSYFDYANILEIIKKYGANVVCEDISNGLKYFTGQVDTNKDPVTAIADYYFEKKTCAKLIDSENRFVYLYSLIKEYNIDSVIYFSLKFCDNNLMDFPYLRYRLSENDIPVLFLEGEQNMTNIESLKVRIMTFLENQLLN